MQVGEARLESPLRSEMRQRLGHDFSKIPVHSSVGAEQWRRQAPDRLAWAERGVSEPGVALPAGPRAMLEAQFGGSFGDVQLHTGPPAIAAARRLGAAAYTLGHDIAFGDGFYAPHTDRGLRLLSHELTHVLQSRNAAAKPSPAGEVSGEIEALEQEANSAAFSLGQRRTPVRERLTTRIPLLHPIYISSQGEEGYLREAAKF
jgi:hypothetical protein